MPILAVPLLHAADAKLVGDSYPSATPRPSISRGDLCGRLQQRLHFLRQHLHAV